VHGDFPLYAKDKQVKKFIVRALGKDGSGVQNLGMTITYTGSKPLKMVAKTGPNGYTTDPPNAKDLSSLDRVPPVGLWKIELRDPTQATLIDDLLIFIEYEYEEKRGAIGT
jgi:hypothetical protein